VPTAPPSSLDHQKSPDIGKHPLGGGAKSLHAPLLKNITIKNKKQKQL